MTFHFAVYGLSDLDQEQRSLYIQISTYFRMKEDK